MTQPAVTKHIKTLEEVKRVKVIGKYLTPDHVASSDEFLVDYVLDQRRDVIHCGIQEHVEGELFDPWSPITKDHLAEFSAAWAGNRTMLPRQGQKDDPGGRT